LIPASDSFRGTGTPGGVQPAVVPSAARAAPSCCAAGVVAGVTVAGWSRLVAVHEPSPDTSMHACSESEQTPSTLPSASHASPSVHATFFDVVPLNATKQSVAAGPPPAKQSGPGHTASAGRWRMPRNVSTASWRMGATLAEQYPSVNRARPNGRDRTSGGL